jgi:hypothetical protein
VTSYYSRTDKHGHDDTINLFFLANVLLILFWINYKISWLRQHSDFVYAGLESTWHISSVLITQYTRYLTSSKFVSLHYLIARDKYQSVPGVFCGLVSLPSEFHHLSPCNLFTATLYTKRNEGKHDLTNGKDTTWYIRALTYQKQNRDTNFIYCLCSYKYKRLTKMEFISLSVS